MKKAHSLCHAYEVMNGRTGVLVPVCFPQNVDAARGEALLRDNVAAYLRQIAEPTRLCLSVDGESNGGDIARRVASAHGVSIIMSPENRGKLHSAAIGDEPYIICRSVERSYCWKSRSCNVMIIIVGVNNVLVTP